jgi:hypothetical protein
MQIGKKRARSKSYISPGQASHAFPHENCVTHPTYSTRILIRKDQPYRYFKLQSLKSNVLSLRLRLLYHLSRGLHLDIPDEKAEFTFGFFLSLLDILDYFKNRFSRQIK